MSEILGWVGTLSLVALLWGAAFWFGADSRDGRDWWRRPHD